MQSTIIGGNEMKIVNMNTLNETQFFQAAQMLSDELPLGWPTLADATQEVNDWLQPSGECAAADCKWRDDRSTIFIAAIDGEEVIGWCGILPSYSGKVYELHPLVVRHDWQRKGVGTLLVDTLAQMAKEKGGLTLWLGTDDDKPGGETSFAHVDLYDNLPRRMGEFKPGTHQAAFYLKIGFQIIGVMPDANGIGNYYYVSNSYTYKIFVSVSNTAKVKLNEFRFKKSSDFS